VDGAYRATPTGHVALATYDDYTAATGAIDDARPFLDRLPARAPIDTAILRRAEVTLAEPHAPEVALEPCVELRGRAERLRGLAPVALSVCPRRITERVDTGELTVELVARENVVASLPALGEGPGARLLDDDAVTVYETDTSLAYVPWIIETSDGTVDHRDVRRHC
jgi:hypothetical protein